MNVYIDMTVEEAGLAKTKYTYLIGKEITNMDTQKKTKVVNIVIDEIMTESFVLCCLDKYPPITIELLLKTFSLPG